MAEDFFLNLTDVGREVAERTYEILQTPAVWSMCQIVYPIN